MTTEYKVGTISDILSQGSSGKKQKVDPKLAALFGGASSNVPKVFRTVAVKENQILKSKPPAQSSCFELQSGPTKTKKVDKKKGRGTDNDVKLEHKDAAAIRVGAKKKVGLEQERSAEKAEAGETAAKKGKKIKKNKKGHEGRKKAGDEKLQDETISSTSEASGKKVTKNKRKLVDSGPVKKGKRAKISGGEEIEEEEEEGKVVVKEEKVVVKEEKEDGKPAASGGVKTLMERNAPKPKDPELEARTIFVGNLPADIVKKSIKKMFKKYGTIDTIRLRCAAPNKPTVLKKVAVNKKELHSDNNTLAAYVRFATREEAEAAAEKAKGMVIGEQHLVVDLADKSTKKDNKKAIFIGNLHLKTTDEELWRFFDDCGTITSVRVIRDNATGMGKGFGYVNFDDRGSVELALKKNQQEFKNRTLRISRCVKKLKVKKEKGHQGFKKGGGKRPKTEKAAVKSEKWKGKFGKEKKHSKPFKGNFNKREVQEFSGDRLAEIGKLKRKSKKPNRGEIRKAKLAKLLTQPSPKASLSLVANKQNTPNKKIRFD